MGDINVIVKKKYTNDHYVSCYNHQLNKLLKQADSKTVWQLFTTLNWIAFFFLDRRAALVYICNKNILILTKDIAFSIQDNSNSCSLQNNVMEYLKNVYTKVLKIHKSGRVALAAEFVTGLENCILDLAKLLLKDKFN